MVRLSEVELRNLPLWLLWSAKIDLWPLATQMGPGQVATLWAAENSAGCKVSL